MLKIGLTGGIASGKTTISNLFSKLGITVIDTDVISRHLLEIDQQGYQQVVQRFGTTILQVNGEIDRARLRQLVFYDSAHKNWLEETLHPTIYEHTREAIAACDKSDYLLVVVPLLFEAGFRNLVNRVLVIDCSAETQIHRLMARDQINRQLAKKMLEQQLDNASRLEGADDIIRNNSTESLEKQVQQLHQKYKALSTSCATSLEDS